MGRWSIKTLLVSLIVLQALLLFGLLGYSAVGTFREARTTATADAASGALLAAQLIDKAVDGAATMVAAEAELPGYEAVFADPSSCTLAAGGSGVFKRGEIHVIRSDGTVACTSLRPSGGLEGRGYAGSPWLRELDGTVGPVVAGPVGDPVVGRRSLIVAAPIPGVDGALVMSLDLASLAVGLDERAGTGDAAPAFVVTSEDRRTEITRSPGPVYLSSISGTPFTRPLAKDGTTLVGVDGVERIFAEEAATATGWNVYAGISTADAFAGPRQRLRERAVLASLFVLIVVLVGLAINRRIARPIRELARAVDEANHGNLSGAMSTDGPAELARLVERLNATFAMRAEAEGVLVDAYEAERTAGDRLRELDELKNAFLLAVSHELRTPLTSVSGYAALLEDEMDTLSKEQAKEFASAIVTSARRLDGLLMDLLDLERVTRGVMEPRRRPTDMRELVRRVLEHTGMDGVVDVHVPKGIEATVDPALVERIVENLVVNANKHTPNGTPVSVRAGLALGELIVTVEDAGQGVPDELKAAIFEPFRIGGKAEHSPGTGIGLSLVAEFAKLHGGRAWVADRPGGGSAFNVALPAERHELPDAASF